MADVQPEEERPDYLPDGELVVPAEVAPSGHGGSGPAPLPHPLTEEANAEPKPGEVSDPENTESQVDEEDLK